MLSNLRSEIIALQENYQITIHKPSFLVKSDTVVITFDPARGGLKKLGFGSEFVLKQGLINIHVSHKRFSFYQGLRLSDFVDLIKPIVDGMNVFTYGSSEGGYAALYYGGAINAVAIALSPRSTIHPVLKSFKSKFSDVAFVHDDLRIITKSSFTPVIVYDPLDAKDHKFFECVIKQAYPETKPFLLKNGLHSVALSMLRSGVLKQFFRSIVFDGQASELSIDPMKDERYVSRQVKMHIAKGNFVQASEMVCVLLEVFPVNLKRLQLASTAFNQGVRFKVSPNIMLSIIDSIFLTKMINKFDQNLEKFIFDYVKYLSNECTDENFHDLIQHISTFHMKIHNHDFINFLRGDVIASEITD